MQIPVVGPPIPQRVAQGDGALACTDRTGNRYNPHPHLSAVVVVHARANEQDFVDREVAALRAASSPRTEAERSAQATKTLEALHEAAREGRIPPGEYEWVEVFDLSGLDTAFGGTPLPDNIFDGPRDRWYAIDRARGFVERSRSAPHT